MNFLEKIQHKHKACIMILKKEEDTIPGPAGMLKKVDTRPTPVQSTNVANLLWVLPAKRLEHHVNLGPTFSGMFSKCLL